MPVSSTHQTADTLMVSMGYADLQERARKSGGTSDEAIYRTVADELMVRTVSGVLIDVGCGAGRFGRIAARQFANYVGVDAVRYEEFPESATFVNADLDSTPIPLANSIGDVVVAIETIEHVENPRALMRELTRLVKPTGWIVVTTPNQLSLLSLMTLVIKRQFAAFQDVHYPAHLTALLEVDLLRMAAECELTDVAISYTHSGRIVLTPWHFPHFLARLFPRLLSDNILLVARAGASKKIT
jgi:2-polyprenyl-3-methyl-5-hydroxy-6-metoxy-1,4-benzoquinol methylase